MYNLLVAGQDNAWEGLSYSFNLDRVIKEYSTSELMTAHYRDLSDKAIAELQSLPAIFSYELSNTLPARIGYIKRIIRNKTEATIEYAFFSDLPTVPQAILQQLSRELQIETLELYRTHWAIKSADLFQVLGKAGLLTEKHLSTIPQHFTSNSAADMFSPQHKDSEQLPQPMSADDKKTSGAILLMLLAQAYYTVLESVSSADCSALDMELNQSYLWTIDAITKLLKNHEDLQDFPMQFDPIFPDLYPSTIRDIDWEDMVGPEADKFLSTVQKYVSRKGICDPEQGTPAWVFVELFRPSVNLAIERAQRYNKKMSDHLQKTIDNVQRRTVASQNTVANQPVSKSPTEQSKTSATTRDKIFISYCHKDRKHYDEFLAHLKPLLRSNLISAWSDEQIQPGSKWLEEIKTAVASAKVAVLLVTKDFLASDFIYHNELCPFLKAARDNGLEIRWVLVRDCNWKNTPLQSIQAAYPTDRALARRTQTRDEAWVSVCQTVLRAANGR